MTTLADIDTMLADPPDGVTAMELGEWLGLTPNRVHALGRDGVLPRAADKTYPLRGWRGNRPTRFRSRTPRRAAN